MSLVNKFRSGLKGVKVNELYGYTKNFQQEHMPMSQLPGKVDSGLAAYKKKYIDTGSPVPLYQVLGYGFILAYALAWPQEYKHFCAERDAKLAGEKH